MALQHWLAPGLTILVIVALTAMLAMLAVPATGLSMSFEHYEYFFPAWDHILVPLVDQCSGNLSNYRNNFRADPRTGYGILNCVLEDFKEFRKSEMASASVILGLAPALLQQLSPMYADTAVLATRRPLLALLIAGGSPAVRLMEASNHGDLVKKLKEKSAWALSEDLKKKLEEKSAWVSFKKWCRPGPVSVAEYVLALTAIANNVQLAYELGVWTVCSFSPSQTTLPAIWCVSAVIVHLVGWLVMRARLELVVEKANRGEKDGILRRWLEAEVTPLRWGARTRLKKETEDPVFLVLASCLYVGTAVQTLYGTLILSSLVFIGVGDATVVVLRYIASTLVCRLLVICELSGMRPLEHDGLVTAYICNWCKLTTDVGVGDSG